VALEATVRWWCGVGHVMVMRGGHGVSLNKNMRVRGRVSCERHFPRELTW
jgi:hypothetical protein